MWPGNDEGGAADREKVAEQARGGVAGARTDHIWTRGTNDPIALISRIITGRSSATQSQGL